MQKIEFTQLGGGDAAGIMEIIGKFLQDKFPCGVGAEGMRVQVSLPGFLGESGAYVIPAGTSDIRPESEAVDMRAREKLDTYLAGKAEDYAENSDLKRQISAVQESLETLRKRHKQASMEARKLREALPRLNGTIERRGRIAPVLAEAAKHRKDAFIRTRKGKDGDFLVLASCTVEYGGQMWAVTGMPWLDAKVVEEGWTPGKEEDYFTVGWVRL